MKVYFNRILRREAYGGGAHFHSAMHDFLVEKGHEVVSRLHGNIDLIFMLDPRMEAESQCSVEEINRFKKLSPKTKVLFRINENDARKQTNFMDALILASIPVADRVVYISDWLQKYFLERGVNGPSDVVRNGARDDWFYPAPNVVLGSQHKLVTHHWSNSPFKGLWAYQMIDELLDIRHDLEFTYIGRFPPEYKPRNIRLVDPLYGEELGAELRKHHVYVTGTKYEPCGMHWIEGLRCGLPLLYGPNAGAVGEGCEEASVTFRDRNSFVIALTKVLANYKSYRSSIPYQELTMRQCCESYYKIMQEMVS